MRSYRLRTDALTEFHNTYPQTLCSLRGPQNEFLRGVLLGNPHGSAQQNPDLHMERKYTGGMKRIFRRMEDKICEKGRPHNCDSSVTSCRFHAPLVCGLHGCAVICVVPLLLMGTDQYACVSSNTISFPRCKCNYPFRQCSKPSPIKLCFGLDGEGALN
jgi:hypothetical protein